MESVEERVGYSVISSLCALHNWTTQSCSQSYTEKRRRSERLLLNQANTLGFLAPGGEEFNPGPETRLDRSELLCNKVLLKYKGDRESF